MALNSPSQGQALKMNLEKILCELPFALSLCENEGELQQ